MKTILLVEDSDDDVFLMKRACAVSGVPHSVQIVRDGQAAVDYLSGCQKYEDRDLFPLPNLIFLDVHLPLCGGHEVLEWLRTQPVFNDLPVIMLTSSDQPSDIERAYSLGVTSYMLKNANPAEFIQGIRTILQYWLQLNKLPMQAD